MRVVLSTYGTRGDVEPMIGLAIRLQEYGVQVRVCAPPDFVLRMHEIGVPATALGASWCALWDGIPLSAWTTSDGGRILVERAAELTVAQREVLLKVAPGCDLLVVAGVPEAVANARSVGEKLGIGVITVAFQQHGLPSPHRAPWAYPGRPYPPEITDIPTLWSLHDQSINTLFGPAVNTSRAALGLPAVKDVASYLLGDQVWLASDPVLDPWNQSDQLQVVQTGAWLVSDKRPLADDLSTFLAAGPPPIYVGFGSMPVETDLVRTSITAIRSHGYRIVVMRGWADSDVIDNHKDCFVIREVNQRALFPRVAAVVHHGGAGTTATAARAGVPQAIVPQVIDQFYWANRVSELGIGVAHDDPSPTFESLSALLNSALTSRVRTRATAVATSITDGASVAAKLLLDTMDNRR